MNLSTTFKLILIAEACVCFDAHCGRATNLFRLDYCEIEDYFRARRADDCGEPFEEDIHDDDLDFALRFAEHWLEGLDGETGCMLESLERYRGAKVVHPVGFGNGHPAAGQCLEQVWREKLYESEEDLGDMNGIREWYVDADPARLDVGELTLGKWHVTKRFGVDDAQETFVDPRDLSLPREVSKKPEIGRGKAWEWRKWWDKR